ncbi:hypothetical protein [Streptomyces sp. TRM49041]|uniref:hypothetical protein n=1 Tax=Streptomyces sp. TRM49041 TaxID=2603216 RepID=UPI00292A3D65|nr:hypothetical protein [Streptomyces sp. TRM49041]
MEIARVVVIAAAIAVGIVVYRRVMGPSERTSSRDAEALGFLPVSRQNTLLAGPAPELERALAAVARGSWEQAARLMAATRESRDWERRSDYASAFGAAAAEGDGAWLRTWTEAAGPYDPDLALVRADATVSLAWRLRGGAYAKHTSQEQFAGFHRTLAQAPGEIERAADLNPDDPTPYIAGIWVALGLGHSHEEMRDLWAELTARSPHHFDAHYAALQYWCAKWRGSAELAESFARGAAATAPPGSLLTALPLIAWFEHRDDGAKAADYRSPQVMAMVDAALTDLATAPPGHPSAAEVRHLLAYFLTRQGRYEAALEQFRLVDGYVDALPWTYYNDRAAAYCRWRAKAVKGAR